MVQDQKPSGNDVKCAEIKTLQTGANGFSEKQKNFFKIGEYNRATATFEMNSTEDLRQTKAKPKFDLSSDTEPCHYFKSSFARSIVVNSADKCRSMDFPCTRRNGYGFEEGSFRSTTTETGENRSNGCGERLWLMPGKEVSFPSVSGFFFFFSSFRPYLFCTSSPSFTLPYFVCFLGGPVIHPSGY